MVGEARQPWRERPGPHRPDGWPLWTSEVRPGREHDTTALREHAEILPLFTAWAEDHLRVLGDLGYEGEADTITIAFKKPKGGELPARRRPTTRSATASAPSASAATHHMITRRGQMLARKGLLM